MKENVKYNIIQNVLSRVEGNDQQLPFCRQSRTEWKKREQKTKIIDKKKMYKTMRMSFF